MYSTTASANPRFPLSPALSHHSECHNTTKTSQAQQPYWQISQQQFEALPSFPTLRHCQSALFSGLQTPPSDDMATTYHMPNPAAYESHHVRHHPVYTGVGLSGGSGTKAAAVNDVAYEPSAPSKSVFSNQQRQQPVAYAYPSTTLASTSRSASRHSTKPSTPQSQNAGTPAEQSTSARDAAMVLHSLQIPTCISPTGGNLADFAAQITCLLWFESVQTLDAAEQIRTPHINGPARRLTENAIPIPNFKKWVHTVLSTTQVTQNVVLLALLFIYRLKMANPNVNGRPGSEYRLLTVALMLGNKFLDDNTYTNKTWAEVSGISVGEIHVMEVEFLSNMRYSLLVSTNQWEDWLVKLAKFWKYCVRAQQPPPSPLAIPSPSHRSTYGSPLPSPTGAPPQMTPTFVPSQQHIRHTSSSPHGLPGHNNQPWPVSYQAANAISPLASKPDFNAFGKRAMADDQDPSEPPAKRVSRHIPAAHPQQPQFSSQPSYDVNRPQLGQPATQQRPAPTVSASDPSRLSVPNLTVNTSTATTVPPAAMHPATSHYVPQQTSALSLPPLMPGMRAMSTVYAPTTACLAPTLSSSASTTSHIPAPTGPAAAQTTSYPPHPAYTTPTKRLSPQNSLTPAGNLYASSPLGESFPHVSVPSLGNMGAGSGTHTPILHSPSIFLQQRPSPYKPIRHVNTLLYPPPSAFLHEYHLSHAVPPTQMHYQPLGRRNEYRTGVVPEFAIARTVGYPSAHHSAAPHPVQVVQQMAHGQPNRGQPLPSQYTPPSGIGRSPY